MPTLLLQRSLNAHKGTFGHIFILAGSVRFSGAAVLCASAAMRAGAGLVTLGIPKSLARPVIKIKPKEVMILPLPETEEGTLGAGGYAKIKDFAKGVNVMVIGPGLTQNKSTQVLARKVISGIDRPMVVDADGLNALTGHLDLLRTTRILTPHPGEMARLLGISIKKVQANRKGIAQKFSRDYKVTIVLKGHNSVVADYNGNLHINKTGNPGMATAGSGDVLTGMIAAFLGQGLNAFEASKYAAYLHGLAGDLAAGEKTQIGMIASDIIDKIPAAVKKCS
ncbi:MAG: NAD(P)H-hydrate dehydratase [Candidatus Omnitrophota bacterium]